MKYRCLVLDHDDTVVNSTATIHFPCFLAYLREFYPEKYRHGYTLEEYFSKNFSPGMTALLQNEIGLDEAGMEHEYQYWCSFARDIIPEAYPGIREILERHRREGGLICVISHSVSENIYRDYRKNNLPKPDAVYGWDTPPEWRKPSPLPLKAIMERFDLLPDEILVVDDLKPGYDMAKSCGVPFAAAGWASRVPEIARFMLENSDYYFPSVSELADFLQDSV